MPRLRSRVAKAGAVVGTRSLSATVSAMSGPAGPGNIDPDRVIVPPGTEAAMVEDGMANGGFWSPGRPLQPYFPMGDEPRGYDFPVGVNIAERPRTSKSKAAFETLKNIVGAYDVARICIEHKQDDIRSLDWRIVPRDGVKDDVQAQVDIARKFMEKPDGITPFDSWQSSFLEDVFRYDAGTLYRGRMRSGEFGGLEVVDGTTIAPLIDYYGRRPMGEAPAFVQWLQGAPAMWLRERDLIYQPFRLQPEGVYGLPPIEWLLLNVNTDIRFQWHFLNYFTEGTLPAVFMEAPPDMSSAAQVAEFQAAWNTVMEGDQAQKWKVRFVPSGSKPHPLRDEKFDPAFPLHLMRKTCAAYKVTPNDIGFTEDVNRATASTQVDIQSRIGKYPTLKYLEGIYTTVLQQDLGLPGIRFEFDRGEEKEDALTIAQAHDLYVKMGAEGVDEVRDKELGLPIDSEFPTPRFILTRNGATPLKDLLRLGGENIDPETAAPEGGSIEPDPDDEPEPTGLEPAASVDALEVPGKSPDNTPTAAAEAADAPPAAAPPPGATAAVAKELRAFQRFAKARADTGEWRDFTFESLDPNTALALNAIGRRDPARARGAAQVLARREEPVL